MKSGPRIRFDTDLRFGTIDSHNAGVSRGLAVQLRLGVMKFPILLSLASGVLAIATLAQDKPHEPPDAGSEGVGRVHMDISCSPTVSAEFDRALALLHNF